MKIDPPFDGKRLGVKNKKLSDLFVASRWKQRPLFPPVGWPVSVYIFAPRVANPGSLDEVSENDVTMVGWGELYPTAEWARDPHGHAKSMKKG
jgi:hypothetical protein